MFDGRFGWGNGSFGQGSGKFRWGDGSTSKDGTASKDEEKEEDSDKEKQREDNYWSCDDGEGSTSTSNNDLDVVLFEMEVSLQSIVRTERLHKLMVREGKQIALAFFRHAMCLGSLAPCGR